MAELLTQKGEGLPDPLLGFSAWDSLPDNIDRL
jgi:hypothetical protein